MLTKQSLSLHFALVRQINMIPNINLNYVHVEYCGLDFCVPRLAVICMDDPEPNVSSM